MSKLWGRAMVLNSIYRQAAERARSVAYMVQQVAKALPTGPGECQQCLEQRPFLSPLIYETIDHVHVQLICFGCNCAEDRWGLFHHGYTRRLSRSEVARVFVRYLDDLQRQPERYQ